MDHDHLHSPKQMTRIRVFSRNNHSKITNLPRNNAWIQLHILRIDYLQGVIKRSSAKRKIYQRCNNKAHEPRDVRSTHRCGDRPHIKGLRDERNLHNDA